MSCPSGCLSGCPSCHLPSPEILPLEDPAATMAITRRMHSNSLHNASNKPNSTSASRPKALKPALQETLDNMPHPNEIKLGRSDKDKKDEEERAMKGEKPKPKPKAGDEGTNMALKPATFRQLNVRLRRHGLVLKRVVPPDALLGETASNILSSSEIVEYEIVGLWGQSEAEVMDTLAFAAEQDKQARVLNMQKEKEKAEDGAGEKGKAKEETGKDVSAKIIENEGDAEEESGKRNGSGPPLGVFYEEVKPASDVAPGK